MKKTLKNVLGKGSFKPSPVFFEPSRQVEVRCALKNYRIFEHSLERLIKFYLAELGFSSASLSLLICGQAQSRALNKRFRHMNKATDILSFPTYNGKGLKGIQQAYLGDLALDLPYVVKAYPRFAHTLSGEMGMLLLHGILHLVGYHHDGPIQEKKMWVVQNRLFSASSPLLQKPLFFRR